MFNELELELELGFVAIKIKNMEMSPTRFLQQKRVWQRIKTRREREN